jgi:hypothetical protein
VDDLLPALRVRGEYTDDLESAALEVVREREAVDAGELDADQDLVGPRTRDGSEDPFRSRVESLASGVEGEGLGVGAAAGPDDQTMLELPGIDSDDRGRKLRPAPLPGLFGRTRGDGLPLGLRVPCKYPGSRVRDDAGGRITHPLMTGRWRGTGRTWTGHFPI